MGHRGRGRCGLRKARREKIDLDEKGGDNDARCFLKQSWWSGARGVRLEGATRRRARGHSMAWREGGRGVLPAAGTGHGSAGSSGIWIGEVGGYDVWALAQCWWV
jgi:hypothetical protein